MAKETMLHTIVGKKLADYRGVETGQMKTVLGETEEQEIGFSAQTLDEKLVELHDAARRYEMAGRGDALLRARVAGTIGDVVSHDLSTPEREAVADIILSLVRQAEIDLRESISERLCMMEGVPAEIVLQLAHDAISVARPVLTHSPVLTEMDLLYIIRSKPAEYWQAIAQRRFLDMSVVDALVGCNNEGTALCLLLNDTIELKTTALEAFAELTKYSDKMAEPLLNRRELPEKLAMQLFWYVSSDLRDRIIKKFKIPKDKLDAALQDALQDFTDTATASQDLRPSRLMVDLAAQYGRAERISDAMLIKTLRRGQVRFFVAMMAERTGLSHETVEQIMRQVGGQGMAIACRACGVIKENFISLFLLSRSLTTADRAVDALELRKALKYFDALTEDMATTILANTIIEDTKH